MVKGCSRVNASIRFLRSRRSRWILACRQRIILALSMLGWVGYLDISLGSMDNEGKR